MAGELVKWSGGKLAKPSPDERTRQAKEALRALLRPQGETRGAGTEEHCPAAVARLHPGLVVDLPRICALHGCPREQQGLYAARYVFDRGRFRLGSMIAVTEALYMRQYAGNENRVAVPGNELGQETCPLCGASGYGSVRCGSCGLEVCYGRTSGRYFRCWPGCKGEGVMQARAVVQHGVTPVDMRWR
jgi:hypothetical protein